MIEPGTSLSLLGITIFFLFGALAMDDPVWVWPAWKFGFKRNDLFTTLKDQYNTFSCSIQDPEAFHHDVYEISNEANTAEDFHRLMASRRQQRLKELDQLLENVAFEIIANPDLIGTEKWKLAVQVFRTRSLDALVGYFSSYVPDLEAEARSQPMSSKPSSTVSSPRSSFSDSCSDQTCGTKMTDVDGDKLFFFDDPIAQLTHEPLSLNSDIFPLPRADLIGTDESCPSIFDDCSATLKSFFASNADAMSYSGSESEQFIDHFECPFLDDESLAQSDKSHIPVLAGRVKYTGIKSQCPCMEAGDLRDRDPHELMRHTTHGCAHEYCLAGLPSSIADCGGNTANDETFAVDDDDETPTSQQVLDDPMISKCPVEGQPGDQTPHLASIAMSLARRLPSPSRSASKQRNRKRDSRHSTEIRRSWEEAGNRVQKSIPGSPRARLSARAFSKLVG